MASIKRHIPNTITCCNLFSGCVAVTMAFQGQFEWTLAFIVLGAVFDFFDGMAARLLKVSSPMGVEMDSLADDVTFEIRDAKYHILPIECQIGGMYEGDASRKRTLVDHGFRLPSALDNRPLKWDEFLERIGQTVYLSATPGPYELSQADGVVEQIIRPTGLIDPQIVVKETKGQIDDLMDEINLRVERDERVLVTTLTKRMAEDLTEYLLDHGVKVEYLHSDVDTLRRVELMTELRRGVFDVLVGINLLREGLDLPEVSLVSILDADKEGFLRSNRSLIQTIGRAARNVSGEVHMYADKITGSMQYAIDETNRRREIQIAHNKKHGIDPQPLRKRIADITDQLAREDADTADLMSGMAGIKTGFDYGMGKRGYTAAITEEQQRAAMTDENTNSLHVGLLSYLEYLRIALTSACCGISSSRRAGI